MDITHGPYVGFGWQLIGGDLALDLVNTVAWRNTPHRATDRLVDGDHLADWLAVAAPRHGWSAAVTPADLRGAAGHRALVRVRELREATAGVLAAYVDRQPVPDRALRTVRERYDGALSTATVAARLPLRHEIRAASADQIPALLALAAGRLLSRDDLDRLHRCSDADCGWLFLDTSRNQSRRWCDPGDCGNRARVRAFADRNRHAKA